MDTLNNNNSDFNWDEINVGDYNLDHSENFFAAGSSNMGNAGFNILTPKKTQDHYQADYLCAAASSNKENLPVPLNWNHAKQEVMGLDCKRETLLEQSPVKQDSILNMTPESREQIPHSCKREIGEIGEESLESQLQLQLNLSPAIYSLSGHELYACKQDMKEDSEDNESLESKPKLKLNWTPCPVRRDDAAAVVVGAPRAYECKDVYQAKREMVLRQRKEEERKAREFHSKPVPNFKAMHKRLAETIVIHKITIPVTPETVKHSIKCREQDVKMSELDNGKGARRVLHDSKPFQLRSDQRVRERREYDHVVQCNQLQKKKQQDEERKLREMEEIKELRKMTEFKARPNPFK